jgi:hypothetical protein
MVDNRVMRKMFGPKRDEETGEEKTAYEDFCYLDTSPNIIRMIKSRKIRWSVMWHVWGRRGEGPSVRFNELERDHLENMGVDRKIILTLIFKSWNGKGKGFILLRIERGGGLL